MIDKGELKMKYRKKPVVIDAIQLKSSNLDQVLFFINGVFPVIDDQYFEKAKDVVKNGLTIFTLEDGEDGRAKHVASIGDYIIKGVHGEFYPCKPDIFLATYEVVD